MICVGTNGRRFPQIKTKGHSVNRGVWVTPFDRCVLRGLSLEFREIKIAPPGSVDASDSMQLFNR